MKQAQRSMLSLVVFAGVAGALAYWGLIASENAPLPENKGKAPVLVKFSHQEVTKIVAVRRGHTAVVEKKKNGWLVTKPVTIGADPSKVTATLRQLENLRPKTSFGGPGQPPIPDSALSGLDAPWARLEVYAGQERPFIIVEVGAQSDFDHQSYARVTRGDDVATMTLPPSARSLLVSTAEDYYDRRVLGANPVDVIKLQVQPAEETPDRISFTVERPPTDPNRPAYLQKDRFDLVTPDLGRADSVIVRKVLQALVSTPATHFMTTDHQGDLARYGLDPKATKKSGQNLVQWTITFWVRPPKSATVHDPIKRTIWCSAPYVGEDGLSWVRIARSDQPWVAEVGTSFADGLALSQNELMSKRLFDFLVADVTRLDFDLVTGGRASIVKREKKTVRGTGWWFVTPKEVGARHERVTAMLLTFVNLIGASRVPLQKAVTGPGLSAEFLTKTGLGENARVVRFYDVNEHLLGALRIGKVQGDSAFAMAQGGHFAVLIPASKVEELPHQIDDLMILDE